MANRLATSRLACLWEKLAFATGNKKCCGKEAHQQCGWFWNSRLAVSVEIVVLSGFQFFEGAVVVILRILIHRKDLEPDPDLVSQTERRPSPFHACRKGATGCDH